jgi:copper(I)-binding protein/(2Fe-2S) ferredoxin
MTDCIILLGRGMPKNEQADTLDGIRERLLASDSARHVEIAFLEMTPPGLPDVLSKLEAEGLSRAIVVPMFVPYDRNVKAWLPRVIQRGKDEGRWLIDIRIAPPLEAATPYAEAVESAVRKAEVEENPQPVRPMRRRPNNSRIPPHTRHVFVCLGPRCVEAGGWAVLDAFRNEIAGRGLNTDARRVLCTRSACQHPCNLAPLVSVYPDGVWYGELTPDDAREIVVEHFEKNTPVDRLSYRPGEVLRSDPMDIGDADDPSCSTQTGTIAAESLFARRAMHVPNAGAVFGTFRNTGDAPDALVEISSPGISEIWLHNPAASEPVSLPLAIAPGSALVMQPGRLHLMLAGLMHQTAEGVSARVRFRFERAGEIDLDIPVNASPVMGH